MDLFSGVTPQDDRSGPGLITASRATPCRVGPTTQKGNTTIHLDSLSYQAAR